MLDSATMKQTATLHPDAPSATLPESELIDKARAAKILGIKARRVLQLATQRKLEGVKHRPDGSTQVRVMFRLEDVRRYKAERDRPKPIDITPANPSASETGLVKLTPQIRDFAYLLQAAGIGRTEKPQPRPWLTSAEAAEYTGWPSRGLEALRSAGRLRYLDFGKGTRGGRYRFKRVDLDSLEGVVSGRAVAAGQ